MTNSTDALLNSFKRLIHVLTTGKNKPFPYGDITLYRSEVHILEIIGNQPGTTASDIVRHMGVTKGAVSQIITKLRAKGLLSQEIDATDMKVRRLYATPTGKDVLRAHANSEKEIVRLVLKELQACDAKDLTAFTRVVNIITDFAR